MNGEAFGCKKCGFIGDRDVTATINIYRKYVSKHPKCGVFGVAPKTSKADEVPRGDAGEGG